MEARIAKLESDIEYIKRDIAEIKADTKEHRGEFGKIRQEMKKDFRILFGAIISAALGLAALMAHGFKWI